MADQAPDHLTARRASRASRQQVWDVVADGWTYSQWVVGNSRMRAVDADWPRPGSSIRHSIGVWPLVIDDSTIVEECVPQQKLALAAQMGWLGAARITLLLSDTADGCCIEMDEVPVRGPLGWLPDAVGLAMVWPRNRECLWRLSALAERQKPGELDT